MATNKRTADNDKYFFRNEYISSDSPNIPIDLLWAVKDLDYTTSYWERDNPSDPSTVGSIIYTNDEWSPGEAGEIDTSEPQVPTPIITGVVSQRVVQNEEGAAKTNVVLAVQCIDGVEYNVRVTAV